VRIKVIELFKGENRPEATIAQWVSREGRSKFQPGEKYLFHLDRKPSGDELHFYGALLPDSPDASEEFELIRAIQTSASSTVLTGRIGIDATMLESPFPGVPAGWVGDLKGATVRITSQTFSTIQTRIIKGTYGDQIWHTSGSRRSHASPPVASPPKHL
jgi:hypothetical protein